MSTEKIIVDSSKYATCRLNSESRIEHIVLNDGEEQYLTLCNRGISEYAMVLLEFRELKQTTAPASCSTCIKIMKRFEAVPTPLAYEENHIYVVEATKAAPVRWVSTHYFFPLYDEPETQDRAVCGTFIEGNEGDFVLQFASPNLKAKCQKCLASPKVPVELRDQEAIQALWNRGRYERPVMYPTNKRIIEE